MTAVRWPTRATVEGRAYLDLQNLARRERRPTDELHQLYALEGFLSRLATSRHADKLVLKGGVLLAAYNARRPTRDVDVQARAISGEREHVLRLVCDVAAAPVDDGLHFDTNGATSEVIRDDDEYSGVRVTLTATLASAKLSLHVDTTRKRSRPHYSAGPSTRAGVTSPTFTSFQGFTLSRAWATVYPRPFSNC